MASITVPGTKAPLVVGAGIDNILRSVIDFLTTDALVTGAVGGVDHVAVADRELRLVFVREDLVDVVEGFVAVLRIEVSAGALAALE